MECKYCRYKKSVKNGFDRQNQRYKCKRCKKTFTEEGLENADIRACLHLFIAGAKVSEISEWTGFPSKNIKRFRDLYLKRLKEIAHPEKTESFEGYLSLLDHYSLLEDYPNRYKTL